MFLCDVKRLSEAMCVMLCRGGIALLHFELEIDCSLDVKSCMKPLRRKKKNDSSVLKLLSISFVEGGIITSFYK